MRAASRETPTRFDSARVRGAFLVPILIMVSMLSVLTGCHELGNPVTRTTEAGNYPTRPPHQTSTRVTYAHAQEAVAWRRPPAHALDHRLPQARYIGRVEVQHPRIRTRSGVVRLTTTIALSDGSTTTMNWRAPADADVWLADVALTMPATRAITTPTR